jgi:RHS repeat-associated protein
MTVAGQPQVSYTFDNANRVTQITQGAASIALSYDNANRQTSLTLPNGINVAYSFDNESRVTGITYTVGANTLGNLTYSYDQLGRRTQVGGSFARTNLAGAITSATYDAANELINWNGTAISYDANGNMLSDGTNTFTWNARNQVETLNGASLQYDAFGRRTKNAAGNSFLFDGDNITQELAGTTPTANIWTGGTDEFFQRADSNGTVVPLADALGSIIALADGNGNLTTQYTYDPFGNTTSAGAISANRSEYTGRENDGNGLYFYRARYYSPTFGRFVSEDPLGFLGSGTNFYAYARNSPTNLIDPSGLFAGNGGGSSVPSLAGRKDKDCKCLDIDKLVAYMQNQDFDHINDPDLKDPGPGHCAMSVRKGLEAGGLDTTGRPEYAKDYGPSLIKWGFEDVGSEGVTMEKGDIAVYQPVKGSNKAGHISVWDGSQMISDYEQQPPEDYTDPKTKDVYPGALHFYPNMSKHGPQPYVMYRYKCKCK